MTDALSVRIRQTNRCVHQGISSLLQRNSTSKSLRRFFRLALSQKTEYDRAFFVRVGYELAAKDWRTLKLALVAVEMLDSAIIVIDDIMDQNQSRGGRPALYRSFGLASSLSGAMVIYNASISLLTHFLRKGPFVAYKARTLDRLVKMMERTWVGQWDDSIAVVNGLEACKVEDYFKVITATTGFQVGAYLQFGAILGGLTIPVAAAVFSFGLVLGTLFQVRDDYLDYFGSRSTIAKKPFTDYAAGNARLPLLLALKHASPSERKLLLSRFGRGLPTRHQQTFIRSRLATPEAIAELHLHVSELRRNAENHLCRIAKSDANVDCLRSLLSLATGI